MLAGKRIILAGLKNSQREIFAQNLAHFISQNGEELELSEKFEERREGDYVILFGQIEKTDPDIGTGALRYVMEQMGQLAGEKPVSVVLVSDCLVYGKQYGAKYRWKEEELGYVSHTKREEVLIHYMRMMEHLACRLAREEQLPIKVVRQSGKMEEADPGKLLDAVLTVLLSGEDGVIYNLPVSDRENRDQEEEERSPLSPVTIVPNTDKIENLMAQQERLWGTTCC